MEVLAIQKSALDGMKNELEALLELTENATQKYTPIFKEEQCRRSQKGLHPDPAIAFCDASLSYTAGKTSRGPYAPLRRKLVCMRRVPS